MTVGRSAGGTVWNIQILRFVAAAMVLFGHLNHEVLQRPDLDVAGFRPFEAVWWPGGVDIFFVISGFIMYHISAGQFGKPGASRQFLERRIIRLVPPYWGFTILVLIAMALFPAQLASNATSPWHSIASFLFIPAANPSGAVFPVLILGWTLNFEMLFYLCFAIGLTQSKRIGTAIICGLLLLLAASFLLQPLPMPFTFWSNTVVIEFLFGIAIAEARRRGVRLSVPVSAALVVAGIGALLLLRGLNLTGHDFGWRFLWAGAPALLLCTGLALVPEAADPGRIKRALVFGGDMSFAIYLSHPFTLTAFAFVMARMGVQDPWLYIAISFIACLVVAGFVFVWIERPVYRWLTRVYNRPRRPGPAVSAT